MGGRDLDDYLDWDDPYVEYMDEQYERWMDHMEELARRRDEAPIYEALCEYYQFEGAGDNE